MRSNIELELWYIYMSKYTINWSILNIIGQTLSHTTKVIIKIINWNIIHIYLYQYHIYDRTIEKMYHISRDNSIQTRVSRMGMVKGTIRMEAIRSTTLWWTIKKSTRLLRNSLIVHNTNITKRLPSTPVTLCDYVLYMYVYYYSYNEYKYYIIKLDSSIR